MKKLLITGVSGFVARHFLEYLDRIEKCQWIVWGIDKSAPPFDVATFLHIHSFEFYNINLLHGDALQVFFKDHRPDYILHLAAFSSVAFSWDYPDESFLNNSVVFLNLINVVRVFSPECRFLSVGSSEEYGNVAKSQLPIREDQALNPVSPYAVARVSQEQLSSIFYKSFHINIIMTRSFNHIGPFQDTRFAVPGFIERIARLKREGKREGIIETGNTEIIRDFLDVRDVAKAYYILLTRGRTGEVYNICSGRRIALIDILKQIADKMGVKVTPVINDKLIRPNDNFEMVGSYYKMESEFGWRPMIDLETTLDDMIKEVDMSR